MSLPDISVDESEQIPQILEPLSSGLHDAVLPPPSAAAQRTQHGGDAAAAAAAEEAAWAAASVGGLRLDDLSTALHERTPAVMKLRVGRVCVCVGGGGGVCGGGGGGGGVGRGAGKFCACRRAGGRAQPAGCILGRGPSRQLCVCPLERPLRVTSGHSELNVCIFMFRNLQPCPPQELCQLCLFLPMFWATMPPTGAV